MVIQDIQDIVVNQFKVIQAIQDLAATAVKKAIAAFRVIAE